MTYPDTFEQKIGFDHLRQWVAERCASPLGRRHAEEDLTFSADYATVEARLSAIAEMLAILRGDEEWPSPDVRDVGETLARARVPGTFIGATELLDVRGALATLSALSAFFDAHRHEDGGSDYPYLDEVGVRIASFPQAVKAIDRVIDRFGQVRDGASPQLRELRTRLAQTTGAIASMMRRVLARAAEAGYIDSDVAPTMRDGRLVIPVPPAHKRHVAGIVHDESASGKTVYIEPAEIVEANNRIRELQMEERREIVRILTLLADELRPDIPYVAESLDQAGRLDFIEAKARLAIDIDARMPALSDGPEMEWYHAMHPVLLTTLRRQGKEVVPLDITLTPSARILVISGPNAGGKSVCLKTVGIVQYMMQCGLLPPLYENSHMGVFADIFIDIGDDQSIEDDLSTYSSHLRNMKYFVGHGGAATLMLIDEFGGGTEPQIGGAIAQAVLRQYNERRMWGVITTHYQNLKQFAEDTEGLVNGSMLYDRHLMQPMFRLSIGNPGSSFAVEIARKIGLPEAIIADAEAIVGSDYINLDKYLLDIARDKRYWENKRLAIRQKEKKIETRLAQYEEDAEQLRLHRREILNEAKDEARKILEGSNAAIERTIHEIRLAQAEKESTLEARRRLDQEKAQLLGGDGKENALLRKAPRRRRPADPSSRPAGDEPLRQGDNVRLDGQGTVGKVLAVSGKKATVAFGVMQTEVPLARLQRTLAQPQSGAKGSAALVGATSDAQRQRQLNFSQEIDVRGMRVDEAVQAVTYYIDDAIRFNAERVRILHGTGTGALRQYIRQYLSTVQGLRGYHDEHVQLGGAGITVVDLR